jgi:hypothetical protein
MEKNPQPVRNLAGWEGYPLVKCRYSVKDSVDGRIKTAEVIMLNAEPKKLARWVVSTCIEGKGSARLADLDLLSRHIIGASGAQFPVVGIVLEAMNNTPRQKVYCFDDGVMVPVASLEWNRRRSANRGAQASHAVGSIASPSRLVLCRLPRCLGNIIFPNRKRTQCSETMR